MRVLNVEYLEDYKLKIKFSDKKTKIVDCEEKVKHAKGIFLPLKNVEYFKQVSVDDKFLSLTTAKFGPYFWSHSCRRYSMGKWKKTTHSIDRILHSLTCSRPFTRKGHGIPRSLQCSTLGSFGQREDKDDCCPSRNRCVSKFQGCLKNMTKEPPCAS